jgi:polyisoprenoid-binding protein YceI
MHVRNTMLAALAVATLALAACEDPAANAPKATVSSAKPVATTAATSKASAAATGTAAAAPTGEAPAAAAPAKPAGALDLSPTDSKVEWTGSKVTGKHDGKFEKFTGWIALEGDKPESAKIHVDIDVASLKSDSEKLEGHLKTDDFFAIDKYPTATFTSTEIKAGGEKGATHTITGNLKMRGVEKSVSFPATVKVDEKEVTAKAEFSINRKDWGIAYEGKKDDLVRDDVVIRLDIKAARPAK